MDPAKGKFATRDTHEKSLVSFPRDNDGDERVDIRVDSGIAFTPND